MSRITATRCRTSGRIRSRSDALLAFASGHAAHYIVRLATTGPTEMGREELPDWPPINLLGAWWLPIGTALAVVLTRFGFPGLAGMALTPYWIGNYGLMALVDLGKLPPRTRARRVTEVARSLPAIEWRLGYRPGLDGLRGVAWAAVVNG